MRTQSPNRYKWGQNDLGRLQSRLGRLEDLAPYKLRSDAYAASQGSFAAPVASALTSGLVDLSSTGIYTVGAIPPTVNTAGFAATSASGAGAGTSNIHIYWDGTNSSQIIVIRRTDQTAYPIAGSDKNITGLNPSTTYYFLPFWNPFNPCGIGWVQGTVGTPQIAFTVETDNAAVAQQVYQKREPLTTGFMSFVTPAAMGSSGGTGAGGGGSDLHSCVMLGTDIEPLGNSPHRNVHHPCSEWWRVVLKSGKSLNGTPNHPIYHADSGKQRLDGIKVGDWLITDVGEDKVVESQPFQRLCTKIQTEMDWGHLYYANGLLSHNFKPR